MSNCLTKSLFCSSIIKKIYNIFIIYDIGNENLNNFNVFNVESVKNNIPCNNRYLLKN